MILRSVEDRLREEYGSLLPAIRRVCFEIEARVRYRILPLIGSLAKHEKIEIAVRAKDCESAIGSLRRRQHGGAFDRAREDSYSLTALRDLAGVRVSVFPRARIAAVDEALRQEFCGWEPKHVPAIEGTAPLALKYHGLCASDSAVFGEYQVMPLMTALYWQVQHSAIYKGDTQIAMKMKVREAAVLDAMRQFEEEFERLLLQEQTLHSPE